MRGYIFVILIFLSFIIIGNNVYSYYADITINVDKTGLVIIDGKTNYPDLIGGYQTNEFTSKKGKYWFLNISFDERFSSFIYRIELPKYATVNYIRTPDLSRFEHKGEGLVIIGTGEDKPFNILVQYSIDNPRITSGNSSFFHCNYYCYFSISSIFHIFC
jgi:hypothetical protein